MSDPILDTRSSEDLVGELFRRLYLMRDFSEPTFRAALCDALVVLGRAAHAEAEARARRLALRDEPGPATPIRGIRPWGSRRGYDEDRDH